MCAIALTGLSAIYQTIQPQRALSLNPFNSRASIALLANGLTGTDPLSQLPALDKVAQDAIRHAPIHALAYGLLGEIRLGQGERQTADALFDVALSLSRTEANSLQRTLVRAIEDGDHAAAMEKLDIFFRRWPTHFSSFAPAIPQLLRTPDGYETVLSTLAAEPPWRSQLLGFLDRDPGSIDLAYRLQLDLNSNVGETRPREIGSTLSSLLRNKRYDQAYRLFLLTLNERDRTHYGYVFNGGFDLEPSGRPFDWALASQPGVNVSREARDTGDGEDFRLKLRFLGKPVKQINVGQSIYLPAGHYRLAVNIDASDLKIPKGLNFNLHCIDPRRDVVRINILPGSYRDETLQTEFTLPDSTCRMFRLAMGTDLIAESFRYRYSGTLDIANVSIRRTGP